MMRLLVKITRSRTILKVKEPTHRKSKLINHDDQLIIWNQVKLEKLLLRGSDHGALLVG
jgi:hypothetical protein